MTMAKLLIIIVGPSGNVVHTVVEFPHVAYAEDALEQIHKGLQAGAAISVNAIRMYDPRKGAKKHEKTSHWHEGS